MEFFTLEEDSLRDRLIRQMNSSPYKSPRYNVAQKQFTALVSKAIWRDKVQKYGTRQNDMVPAEIEESSNQQMDIPN